MRTTPTFLACVSLLTILLLFNVGTLINVLVFNRAEASRLENIAQQEESWLSEISTAILRTDFARYTSDDSALNTALRISVASCNDSREYFVSPGPDNLDGPVFSCRLKLPANRAAHLFKTVNHRGYNGLINLAIVVDDGGDISHLRALSHHETAGYGATLLARDSDFLRYYYRRSINDIGQDPFGFPADLGLDGISGATITARAVQFSIVDVFEKLNNSPTTQH